MISVYTCPKCGASVSVNRRPPQAPPKCGLGHKAPVPMELVS